MKLKLDINSLNDDFFADARLLGITAPVKSYQFCLHLNKKLGFNFRLNADFEIHLRKKIAIIILIFTNQKNPIVF